MRRPIIAAIPLLLLLPLLFFFWFRSSPTPPPLPTSLAASQKAATALLVGNSRARINSEISLQAKIGRGEPPFVSLFAGDGLLLSARGVMADDRSLLQFSLAGKSSFASAEQGKKHFFRQGGQWYLTAPGATTYLSLTSYLRTENFLRFWQALAKRSNALSSGSGQLADGTKTWNYCLASNNKQRAALAALWGRSIRELAPYLTRSICIAIDQENDAPSAVSVSTRLPAPALARLLGLRSTRTLQGLRTLRVQLTYQASAWNQVAFPPWPSSKSAAPLPAGERALGIELLPLLAVEK